MRTIKELLQVMLDNKGEFECGLCNWVTKIFHKGKIDIDEYDLLTCYIEENRPSKWSSLSAYLSRNSCYYWKKGDIKPRLKWIKKHIKKQV